jgi:hypothetical protein
MNEPAQLSEIRGVLDVGDGWELNANKHRGISRRRSHRLERRQIA